MANFSSAVGALPPTMAAFVHGTTFQPSDTTDTTKIRRETDIKVEFRAMPRGNSPFNLGRAMKALCEQLLKHGKGVAINKMDGSSGFSDLKDFPEAEQQFNDYFGEFISEKNRVITTLKIAADESLAAIKSNAIFRGYLVKNKVYLFPQRFGSLKIQRIGFFVGQSRHAWRPALEYNVMTALHEAKAHLTASAEGLEHLPPLDTVNKPPSIMILPGMPRYYHKAREQVYVTNAPCLWCEVSAANEIRDLITVTAFDPRLVGTFVPSNPPPPELADTYINTIRCQNEFLEKIRVIPVTGAHPDVMSKSYGEEPSLLTYLFTKTSEDGDPLFTTIERTTRTIEAGKWLFLTTQDNYDEARLFITRQFPKKYDEVRRTHKVTSTYEGCETPKLGASQSEAIPMRRTSSCLRVPSYCDVPHELSSFLDRL